MNKVLIFLAFVVTVFTGCSGCSKSGRRSSARSSEEASAKRSVVEAPSFASKTAVKMVEENGVYTVPVEVNGVPMHFIFDTGAGMISISLTEAMFLYKNGKLQKEDIIGKAQFQDATGSISEGQVIVLKSLKIGTKELTNVEASVVNNLEAPLLLGQSALSRFGKISIDYGSHTIVFE